MAETISECNRFCGHLRCCKKVARKKCPGKLSGHCVSRLEAPFEPDIPTDEFVAEKLGALTKIAANA